MPSGKWRHLVTGEHKPVTRQADRGAPAMRPESCRGHAEVAGTSSVPRHHARTNAYSSGAAMTFWSPRPSRPTRPKRRGRRRSSTSRLTSSQPGASPIRTTPRRRPNRKKPGRGRARAGARPPAQSPAWQTTSRRRRRSRRSPGGSTGARQQRANPLETAPSSKANASPARASASEASAGCRPDDPAAARSSTGQSAACQEEDPVHRRSGTPPERAASSGRGGLLAGKQELHRDRISRSRCPSDASTPDQDGHMLGVQPHPPRVSPPRLGEIRGG